ncbi:hypothetical protein THAOC_04520, partial [Thalassiosira oceanica]
LSELSTGPFFPEWAARAHLPTIQTKHAAPRLLLAPSEMITGADTNRCHRSQDRIGLVTAFMPSRRRLPAAPGKPSFPYLKVYYLPRRCVLAEPSQRTCDIESPRLDGARKIRRPWPQPPESEDWGRPPCVGEDGILPYRLALATILAVNEVGIVRVLCTVVAQLGKQRKAQRHKDAEGVHLR